MISGCDPSNHWRLAMVVSQPLLASLNHSFLSLSPLSTSPQNHHSYAGFDAAQHGAGSSKSLFDGLWRLSDSSSQSGLETLRGSPQILMTAWTSYRENMPPAPPLLGKLLRNLRRQPLPTLNLSTGTRSLTNSKLTLRRFPEAAEPRARTRVCQISFRRRSRRSLWPPVHDFLKESPQGEGAVAKMVVHKYKSAILIKFAPYHGAEDEGTRIRGSREWGSRLWGGRSRLAIGNPKRLTRGIKARAYIKLC